MPFKVITNDNSYEFERELEEFCKDKKVIDVKFSAHYSTLYYDAHYYALVIYDEE